MKVYKVKVNFKNDHYVSYVKSIVFIIKAENKNQARDKVICQMGGVYQAVESIKVCEYEK